MLCARTRPGVPAEHGTFSKAWTYTGISYISNTSWIDSESGVNLYFTQQLSVSHVRRVCSLFCLSPASGSLNVGKPGPHVIWV